MSICIYKHPKRFNTLQYEMIVNKYSMGCWKNIVWKREDWDEDFTEFEFWKDDNLVLNFKGFDLDKIKEGIKLICPFVRVKRCSGCLDKYGRLCNLEVGDKHGWEDDDLKVNVVG